MLSYNFYKSSYLFSRHVGSNQIQVSTGESTLHIQAGDRIRVKRGDVIGIRWYDDACIKYAPLENPTGIGAFYKPTSNIYFTPEAMLTNMHEITGTSRAYLVEPTIAAVFGMFKKNNILL